MERRGGGYLDKQESGSNTKGGGYRLGRERKGGGYLDKQESGSSTKGGYGK